MSRVRDHRVARRAGKRQRDPPPLPDRIQLPQQVLEEETGPQVRDVVATSSSISSTSCRPLIGPTPEAQVGADRRQVDHPRDLVGADGGCRGLAEPILKRADVVGAVARRRRPEKGVYVLRRLDEDSPRRPGSRRRPGLPAAKNFLTLSGRRHSNFTLTSPPKSKRKSATALPRARWGS